MYSIVICTHNKINSLRAVLANFEFLETQGIEFEVHVVVDGSTDGTLEFLEGLCPYYPLFYYYTKNARITGARNHGIERCNGKYVIICDDDVIFHPDYFVNLDKAIKKNPECVQIGNISNIDKLFASKIIQKLVSGIRPDYENFEEYFGTHVFFEGIKKLFTYKNRHEDFRTSVWWAVVTGGNLCIPRKHFENIGVFDPKITGWGPEDADLCYRFFKAGVDVSFNPDCYLYHLDHERDSTKIMESMTKNAVYFIKKHSKPKELYTYLKFTNAKISLKDFNNDCSEIFGRPKLDIPEFYVSMVDYSKKEHILN